MVFILGFLDVNGGMCILDIDVSNDLIGVVLLYIQNRKEKVIVYVSRIFISVENNYCVIWKELLVFLYFVKYIKQYILGCEFLL